MTGQKAFSVILALVFVITMVGMAGCGKTTTSTPPANNPVSADGQVLDIDGGFYKLSKDGDGYTATLVGTNKSANAAKTAYRDGSSANSNSASGGNAGSSNANANGNNANGGNVNGSEITATFATYTTTTTATATAPTPTFELLGSFNIGPGSGWYYVPDGHVTIEVGTGDGTPTPATPTTPPADVVEVPVVGIIDEPDDSYDFDGTDGVLVPGLPDDAVIDAPVEVITDIDEAIDEIIANLPEDSDPAQVEEDFKDWLGPVCPPTIGETVQKHFNGNKNYQVSDNRWEGDNGWYVVIDSVVGDTTSSPPDYTRVIIHLGIGIVSQEEWWGFVEAEDWNKVLANTFEGFHANGYRRGPLSDESAYAITAAMRTAGFDGISHWEWLFE
jgi:hypothetical protein